MSYPITFIINNITAGTLTYLGGTVSVSANSNYTATQTQVFPLCRDANLLSDVNIGNITLSDGVNVFSSGAEDYLTSILNYAPSTPVGIPGSQGTGFVQIVATLDSGSNIRAMRSNQFRDLAINYRNTYKNMTGNGTTTVKSGSGTLHSILINNNTTGGTATIYDNTAASGTKIATMTFGTPSGGLLSSSGQLGPQMVGPMGLEFTTGLTIVLAGSTSNDLTAIYQ